MNHHMIRGSLLVILRIPIHREPLEGIDGCVDFSAGQPYIMLNANSSPQRLRFTLANEIRDVVLIKQRDQHIRVGLRRYRSGVPCVGAESDPIEERLCNRFAAELLMPAWNFDEFRRCRVARPDAVRQCAARFDVSLMAATKRVIETSRAVHASFWTKNPWPMPKWRMGNYSCTPKLLDDLRGIVNRLFRENIVSVHERFSAFGLDVHGEMCATESALLLAPSRKQVADVAAQPSMRYPEAHCRRCCLCLEQNL